MGFEFLLANHAVSAETEEGGGRKGSREAVEAAVRRPRDSPPGCSCQDFCISSSLAWCPYVTDSVPFPSNKPSSGTSHLCDLGQVR